MSEYADLAKLPDTGLEYLARQLEHKLRALRDATSAIGRSMFEQYQEKLIAVRAEQERRAGI